MRFSLVGVVTLVCLPSTHGLSNGKQAVLSMETGNSDELYSNAVTILESLPKDQTGSKTYYHNTHKLSAPTKVIEYLSFRFKHYFDIKKITHGISGPVGRKKISASHQAKLDSAVDLLQVSAQKGHTDSIMLLADMHFFGNYSHTRNFPAAFQYYQQLADMGNATAQFIVGVFHSTGVFDTMPIDQARATLYYTFAAKGGDLRAMMAMGNRHLKGIGTPVDYQKAYYWYEKSARACNDYIQQGPLPYQLRKIHKNSGAIPDEVMGGVYGSGASESSSGPYALEPGEQYKTLEQAIEYYQYLVDENNDIIAHLKLSGLYYQSSRLADPDLEKSLDHAMECAMQVWPEGPEGSMRRVGEETKLIGGICAGIVGQRYLRGEGVEQDFTLAASWFMKGDMVNDRTCANELGMMLYTGAGSMEAPSETGLKYIQKAADREHGMARWNLARIYDEKGEIELADDYTTSAARGGVHAAWYRFSKQRAVKRAYDEAAMYAKQLSEWVDELHSPLGWALRRYSKGDLDSALLGFLIGAEQGFLSSQINVGFLLDNVPSVIDIRPPQNDTFSSPSTALMYWTRASKQSSMDAQCKMGDYYLLGYGTDVDAEKAAVCYTAVADRINGLGLARWNLGWMYEMGVGVEQDFHLAKRYYDLAVESGREAYLPAKLALIKLHSKSLYNKVRGNRDPKSIIEEEAKPHLTIREYWDAMVKRWQESYKLLFQAEEEYDDEYMEDDGDFYDSLVVLAIMVGVSALLAWYRRRQIQQQRRRQEQNQNQEQNQGQNLNRPFGPNLAHPDEQLPQMYQ